MDAYVFYGLIIVLVVFFLSVIGANVYEYKKAALGKTTRFKFAFAPLFTFLTSPILLLLLPLFIIYRQIVHVILLIRFGSAHGGLLDGRDAVYNFENKNPLHLLFVIRYKRARPKPFYDAVREEFATKLPTKSKDCPKIWGAVKKFMGYSYLHKDVLTLNDCFNQLKPWEGAHLPITKEELFLSLEEYTNLPLPNNNTAFWEVRVGTQPVKWNDLEDEDPELFSFPILLRANHTLGDGHHIIKGVYELFSDDKAMTKPTVSSGATTASPPVSGSSPRLLCSDLGALFKFYMRQLYLILVCPSVNFVNSLAMSTNSHLLLGPKLSYRKHLMLMTDEERKYLGVVKTIKKNVPGCTFNDVLLAGLAGSFRDYFQKHSPDIPEYIMVEIPAIPQKLPFDKDAVCCNRLTFNLRKLPMRHEATQTPHLDLLHAIKTEGSFVQDSLENEVNYLIIRVICHFIPAPLIAPVIEMVHKHTSLVSNVPGPPLTTFLNGCPLQDHLAWVATRGYTGVGFALLSYDGRLETTLVVDKVLTDNRKDVEELLKGMYRNIDSLHDEVFRSFNN